MASNENLNKIQYPEKLNNRIGKLIEFLDALPDDTTISAGDTLGYICGWFGEDDNPEDEIETFTS